MEKTSKPAVLDSGLRAAKRGYLKHRHSFSFKVSTYIKSECGAKTIKNPLNHIFKSKLVFF